MWHHLKPAGSKCLGGWRERKKKSLIFICPFKVIDMSGQVILPLAQILTFLYFSV